MAFENFSTTGMISSGSKASIQQSAPDDLAILPNLSPSSSVCSGRVISKVDGDGEDLFTGAAMLIAFCNCVGFSYKSAVDWDSFSMLMMT